MLVKKPFGIGYTLNLANWRSWVVLAVAGGLFFQQQRGEDKREKARRARDRHGRRGALQKTFVLACQRME